jgi:hypothetical protein
MIHDVVVVEVLEEIENRSRTLSPGMMKVRACWSLEQDTLRAFTF